MYAARTLLLLPVLMLVLTTPLRAQNADEAAQRAGAATLEKIYDAMRSGSVESLIDVTADRVDLTLFGSSEMLSCSQARYVIQDFFRNYPPARVVEHETSPSDGNWFASASYWYRGGDGPLTVYLRMRARDATGWELRELRFGRSIAR